MKNQIKILSLLFCLALTTMVSAQELRNTIMVTGAHVHNLSPNEIIINLNYQEYYTSPQESRESKVRIDAIEKLVLQSVSSAGIKSDKITMGAANFIQPNRNNGFKKGRIDKSLYVCVSNTDEYIRLIEQLEDDGLFDKIITRFTISNYNHTEKSTYLMESRALAYKDAKDKAELILAESNKKCGEVLTIKEINANSNNGSGSFYAVDNSADETTSGFQPINISYRLEVVFEIMD